MTLYLSPDGYVERWGNRETIVITADEPGAQAPDLVKVERAIDDVEELVNGYVRQRYAVPLAEAPRVIVGMVADLARERLHKDRPTPEVTAAADRARSQLKDIAAGRLTLLLDEGEVAESTGDFRSQSSDDAQPVTFSRDRLDAFTSLGRGGGWGGDSRWKR